MKIKQLILLSLCFVSTPAFTESLKGIEFDKDSWDLVCDNTGTCRAAGYSTAESDNPASLLIVREAGKEAAVSGWLALFNEDSMNTQPVTLFLNGKSLGTVSLGNDLIGELSSTQLNALLKNVQDNNTIQVKQQQNEWQISDLGMTAVLLKMDDFQKRVNTPSALVRKGNSSDTVLEPQPKPRIQAGKIPQSGAYTISPSLAEYERIMDVLYAALLNTREDEDGICPTIAPETRQKAAEYAKDIHIYPLNEHQVLLTTQCYAGAYQDVDLAAILNKDLNQVEVIIGDYYGGYADTFDPKTGELSGSFKGRGLGDCWIHGTRVWDGKNFVVAEESTTGRCHGFPGGVWVMPVFVSEVIR